MGGFCVEGRFPSVVFFLDSPPFVWMAFYSIPPPYRVQLDGPHDLTVTVALARDADQNRIVSLICELSELMQGDDRYAEFAFSIAVFALDDSIEPFVTQDRHMAAPYIPEDLRPRVIQVVCEALKVLIRKDDPERFYMVTKGSDLPDKALRKFQTIREALENMGYFLTEHGTDRFSRRFWSMAKAEI